MKSRAQSLAGLETAERWTHEKRCAGILNLALDDLATRILAETPILHADAQDLARVLRAVLELESAKRPVAAPLGGLNGKIRLTLYPDKVAPPGTDQGFAASRQIGPKALSFKAWVSKNTDFVNLEITSV